MKNNKAGEHTQYFSIQHEETKSNILTGKQTDIYTVAVMYEQAVNETEGYQRAKGNLNLIAAAPNMLKALESAQEYVKSLTKALHGEERTSKVIEAAINKAKGL